MAQDYTIDIVDEIDDLIEIVSLAVDDDTEIIDKLNREVVSLVNISEQKDGPIGLRQQSFSELNMHISSRINDVETGVTDERIEHFFNKNPFKKVKIEESGVVLVVEATAPAKVVFSNHYFAELLIPIAIKISGQESSILTLHQRFSFLIAQSGAISSTIIISPRYYRNGVEYDPFVKIPVKKQKPIRNKLLETIKEIFQNIAIKFDQFSIGSVLISSNPYTVFIDVGIFVIVSKALPKRKKPEPLLSYIDWGYTHAIKIKKDILEKEIRRQIESIATLHSIHFMNGFIRISTSRSHRRDILHIKVVTWVRMDYYLFITVSKRTQLLLDARWAESEYRINSERCWPICNDVINTARKIVLNQINNNKYFTRNLTDLRQQARLVKSRVTEYGIQINMKARR